MNQAVLRNVIKENQERYFTPETVYVLAVSMGVDSAVLLNSFVQLNCPIHVVYFHHHKRIEADDEAAYIQTFCENKKIHYDIIDVPSYDVNFQAEARMFRYTTLERISKQYAQVAIVTGHHLDDRIETYFQRLFIGSSILKRAPLRVVSKTNMGIFFRPLCELTKKEIYRIAKENEMVYFEDVSNTDQKYLRNAIRHSLLKVIEGIFPSYQQAMRRELAEVQELSTYFEHIEEQFFMKHGAADQAGIFWVSRSAFLEEHEYVQKFLLERMIQREQCVLKRVRYPQMLKYIKQGKGVLELKKERYLQVEATRFAIVQIERIQPAENNYSFFFVDGFEKLPKQYQMWYNDGYTSWQDTLEITREDLAFLNVRNYQTGDKIKLGKHHKRVRRLFIDEKLPHNQRNIFPIVEDVRTNEIIWIPTLYKSYKRTTEQDKITIYFTDGGFYA